MGGDDFASPTPPSGEKKHSRSRSNAIGRKRKESVTFQNDPDEPLDEIVRPGSVASIDEPEASRDINRAMSLSSNRSAVSSLSTAEAESAVNIYDPPDTTNESNPLADAQYAPNIIEINDGDSLSESQLKATDSNIVEDDATASQKMGEDDIMSNSDGDESLAESLTNEKRDDNQPDKPADDENKDNFDTKSVENETDDHKTTQFVDNSPENFVQCTDNDERFIVSMKNVTDPAFDENEPRAKTDDDVISESNERERRESMSASGSTVGKNVKFDPIVNEIENDGNFQQDGSEVADDESDQGNLAAEEESALMKDEKAGDENVEDEETGKKDEEIPEQTEIKISLENGTCDSEWVKSEVEKLESIEEEPLRNVCEFSLVKSTIEESRAELCSLIQKITERVDASNTLKVFEFIDCEFVPGNDEQTTELSDKIISLLCLHAGSLETIRMSKLKVSVVQLNRLIGGLASSDPSPNAVPEPPFSPPLNYAGTEDDFASSMVDKTLGRVFNELSSCNVLTRVQLNDVIEDSESCFLLIKALKYMQKIRTLDLSEQDFSDVSLLAALGTVLASLPYLEEVYLKNCRVSDENFMSLQPLLWSPRLKLVDLSGNDLSHIDDDEPKKALLSALREKFRLIE